MTQSGLVARRPALDPEGRSFIEVQFPVSKLSKESYKERKAGPDQTLTGLGKWWGRKPLVLVRAIILGLILPATDDPETDRDVFLALMTMDDDGLTNRLRNSLPARTVYESLRSSDGESAFEIQEAAVKWTRSISAVERSSLQRRAFLAMGYDRRLEQCRCPEQIEGPSVSSWKKINEHLGTHATNLPDFVMELGERRFGHVPRVADVFSGGGSIPYEAARIGCDASASDLNPVAAMLTWGALNIVGGGDEVTRRISRAQLSVFAEMQDQINEWGIERNEEGMVADAFLYCVEVKDPVTAWSIPLAPSWVIGQGTKTIARLVPDPANKRFDIEIKQGVSAPEVVQAAGEGTSRDGVRSPVDVNGNWLPVEKRLTTSVDQVRGATKLRQWANEDLVPRREDVFQERLYCIRWVHPSNGQRYFRALNEYDLKREIMVLDLLRERFGEWQSKGFIPSRAIEPGAKTAEPIRTRGWTHWHHLFNPRQLLTTGLLLSQTERRTSELEERVAMLLAVGRAADWNSRLSRWHSGAANEKGEQTFYNQALNTLDNYSARTSQSLRTTFFGSAKSSKIKGSKQIDLSDARRCSVDVDIAITDPGYGDVIL